MGQKTLKKIWGFVIALGAFLILPFTAFGQNRIQTGLDNSVGTLFPRYGIAGSTSLTGPNGLIFNVVDTLLMVAGAIAVLFLIVGGFWYITSAGNEEQAEKGKTAVVNAIIGVIIIVLSYVIINVVANFVAGGG